MYMNQNDKLVVVMVVVGAFDVVLTFVHLLLAK